MKTWETEVKPPWENVEVTTKNGIITPVDNKPLAVWACDVEDEPLSWLWYPYLLHRNINTIGGEAGTGKTQFICGLGAAVTTKQPDGMPGIIEKHGTFLYLGGEDGNSVMRSRLEAAGADLSRCALVEKPIDCMGNEFIELIKQVKPALIVFDPLLSYVGADININSYIDARRVIDYLREVAREHDTCIVLIIHPPKNSNYKLFYRFTGSGAFVDGVRTVTYIGYHPTESNKRVGIQVKTNNKHAAPFIFSNDEELGFIWEGDDPTIKSKDVEAITAFETTGSMCSNFEYYEKVIIELMKVNPTGITATAKGILDKYSKIRSHDINPRSFGQALNKATLQRALLKNGIVLKKAANTHNRQSYNLYYKEALMDI